jgi:hypothetical protein
VSVFLPYLPSTQSACASLYFNLWHVCLHHIFSTLSQKGHNFRKTIIKLKCAFWYYLQLLLKIFLILRIIQQDIFINVEMSSCKVPVILVWLQWNLNFLYRFSRKKLPSFKYYQHPSNASRFIPCGRTDRYDEANNRFTQFCESAKKDESFKTGSRSYIYSNPMLVQDMLGTVDNVHLDLRILYCEKRGV